MSRKLADSMHWQIYQAYRHGPSTLFRLFEEAFGKAALYGPPDPDQQQRTIDDLAQHITRLKAQIEKLQAQVNELHYYNFQLRRRNAELETLVTKDSHNSSRPPSTDPPWVKRTKSLRRPSGRRPGGQAGHRCAAARGHAPTVSSSIGRKSADTVTVRFSRVRSCVTSGSRSGRSCQQSSR
jgi:cell division protein FtsB